jgi:hypothetical protein
MSAIEKQVVFNRIVIPWCSFLVALFWTFPARAYWADKWRKQAQEEAAKQSSRESRTQIAKPT